MYHRDFAEDEVPECMDETSRQQVKKTRVPRPAAPGRPAADDCEYERNGTSNLFMLFAPLEGWRRVEATERRTKVDWARLVKGLADEDYPDKRVVLVMDNLNTHPRRRCTMRSSRPRRGVSPSGWRSTTRRSGVDRY